MQLTPPHNNAKLYSFRVIIILTFDRPVRKLKFQVSNVSALYDRQNREKLDCKTRITIVIDLQDN